MKTVKSLLLGSAAGFVAFTGAQAADLPLAEPVEYVKVCSTYGEGFFYIPGTDTCLQISGKVRVDRTFHLNGSDYDSLVGELADDDFTTLARGVIATDVRSETEWGTLRAYAEYEFNSESGEYDDGDTSGIELIAAFVQFAGITAGKAPSFYDFVEYETINDFFSSEDVWTFAYTASFGSGFAATIGVEDKYYRANPYDISGASNGPAGVVISGGAISLDQVWPNIIAALRVDQAWGSAQISAAVQDNEGDLNEISPGTVDDDIGWAVQAGVKFNLPFANEGSYFVIQGAYSEGATSYAGGEEDVSFGAGGIGLPDQSDTATGLVNNELWQVGAALGIQASETVRLNLIGSYSEFDDAADIIDADYILVEGNIFWTPVDNLDLGVAVLYGDVDFDDPALTDTHDVKITGRIERGF